MLAELLPTQTVTPAEWWRVSILTSLGGGKKDLNMSRKSCRLSRTEDDGKGTLAKGNKHIQTERKEAWHLGPQAQADLLSWGSSKKPASGPKPASRSEEAGGHVGPAPLDVPFPSSCFSRVHRGVCANRQPSLSPLRNQLTAFHQDPSSGKPVTASAAQCSRNLRVIRF